MTIIYIYIYVYVYIYIYILNKKTQTELKKSRRLAKPFLSSGFSKQMRYQRNLKQFCNILEVKTKWLSIEKNQSVKWSLKPIQIEHKIQFHQ